ncbi:hypothetical protein HK097_004894 [Rhizophlyctis rosea]|uniref:Thioredoxin-like fold domain-containing protein n=1 Tax=Rhizophlyctis rosea TaxID=64517 RepID=A0AAD5S1Z5_9FUNG|nr:hypothetical protein HK097_004894 [Rhizophlyctis rosea]
MATASLFKGYRLGSPAAPNVLEFYWDYTCPFSKKSFDRLVKEVHPYLEQNHPDTFAIIFRHQIQPWHPQSTLTHEASIAVHKIDPSKFFAFSQKLFDNQTKFFDTAIASKTRAQIYSDLADLASEVAIDKNQFLALLKLKDGEGNVGNEITNTLKIHLRISRQNAIHVSPTVLVNGLREDSISSSWGLEKWKEFVAAKL